jgi:hypothetical protein
MKRPRFKVRVTDNARRQWRELGGEGELTARLVHYPLREALKKGAPVTEAGVGVEAPLSRGMVAVCVPEYHGVWTVVRVVPRR